LWQLAADAARLAERNFHLAVVVPDGRFLGAAKVRTDTGKTALETLHEALVDARPVALRMCQIELVWRSVAVLKAAMENKALRGGPGAVLVISVNRRIFWTVLELRHWSPNDATKGSPCIVREPIMDDCQESEAWTARRVKHAMEVLSDNSARDLSSIRRWTRYAEILASDMSQESFAELGIDKSAIEHRTWPKNDGNWAVGPIAPTIRWADSSLPQALVNRIEKFQKGEEGTPLAIIVESPVGRTMTASFEKQIRMIAPRIRILRIIGADVARAAGRLAQALGQDRKTPAWLDQVPGIEIKVRKQENAKTNESTTKWIKVIPANEAIPAGETYHSQPQEDRRVSLAPGIEHVYLHFRRGRNEAWDERYSGRSTGHTIRPSEYIRTVEPLARVRPLSGEARIEIIEHLPDGTIQALAASRVSIKWSEMSATSPEVFRSIPELYIFESSKKGWANLEPLLTQVANAGAGSVNWKLKDELYKCINSQWRERLFPLGSDGHPPRFDDPQKFQASQKLLQCAISVLLKELEDSINREVQLKSKVANRMHLPLTWLFTGCPERTVELLLDAIVNPQGPAGCALHINNEFSAWAIYSGVGRAVRSEAALRTIFDNLIGRWESDGGKKQDKFFLAAVTHPMARRIAVRRILTEDRRRFERVWRFLEQHLENILQGIHDSRPNRKQPSLELRYVTMGYRGLCQIRYENSEWFPIDSARAQETSAKLFEASRKVGNKFEHDLVARTAPYLIGEGKDPTMPGGF